MPLKSRFPEVEIPDCSIVTFTFTSATHQLDDSKPLYIDAENPDIHLTHHQYRLLAQRLAVGLLKNGFKKGDRLLLYSSNTIYFPAVVMGTIMAGGIFTGANPTYVSREVEYQLSDSEATFFLSSPESLDAALEAAESVKLPASRVFIHDGNINNTSSKNGIKHWTALLAPEAEAKDYQWDPLSKPGENDQTVVLNYSSGTTGRPKGVSLCPTIII
jgi:4-coumarate--CoA ligase